MKQIDELLELWKKDCDIDRTEPGKELSKVPNLHSKYLNILSRHRLLSKDAEFKYIKLKRVKWEYYTGKMSQEELKERGWEPFQYTYLESDTDLSKYMATKVYHDEIVELCTSILKELHSRTFQLRSLIDWEKFIQGI